MQILQFLFFHALLPPSLSVLYSALQKHRSTNSTAIECVEDIAPRCCLCDTAPRFYLCDTAPLGIATQLRRESCDRSKPFSPGMWRVDDLFWSLGHERIMCLLAWPDCSAHIFINVSLIQKLSGGSL
ncbi:hypothetical protein EDD21DRAFT_350083 [Dissophora ornata]|nr:hypothetical protein EDD21DRAFT_350083 [Dissophora ornata]